MILGTVLAALVVAAWAGPAENLARTTMARRPASSLGWNWGDGLLAYALSRRGEAAYVRAYHEGWLDRGIPEIDRSDRCPPALSALELAERGDWAGAEALARVAGYVGAEPRNSVGAINHLGHSKLRVLFPDSIWVDSLMMYAVFATRWGRFSGDAALLDFGASQPLRFAELLEDRSAHLFRHAWVFSWAAAVPAAPIFWLRGNGWAAAGTVEILGALPVGHAREAPLRDLLQRLAAAVIPLQRPDGAWATVVNRPDRAYAETSGTALLAYALARGAREGWLGADAGVAARRAWAWLSTRVDEGPGDQASLHGTSIGTHPFPGFTYFLIPRRRDMSFGIAAYLLAAEELDR